MKTQTIAQRLRKMNACGAAVDWAETLGHKSMQRAWDECPRADWLLWFAANRNVDRKKLVLAACACARTALKFVPKGEHRPRVAIETAEAWTRGEATIIEVREARHAAVAYAAYAAYASAAAAAAAAYAASAAYAAAAAAAARSKAHTRMCKLVRKVFPKVPR